MDGNSLPDSFSCSVLDMVSTQTLVQMAPKSVSHGRDPKFPLVLLCHLPNRIRTPPPFPTKAVSDHAHSRKVVKPQAGPERQEVV